MSEELKYPDNFDNWPETWQSCFEDGVQAERTRRQEAKPLMEDSVLTALNRLKSDYEEFIQAIHAAMPRTPSREDVDSALDGAEKEWLGFEPHGTLRECQLKWIMALWGKV